MARYQYLSCHPVTRAKLATLRPNDPSWATAVNGNGSFSATFTVPEDPDVVAQMKVALEPDAAALYVKNSAGRYPWGGPIIAQSWDPSTHQVTVTAVEWRSWFNDLFLAPLVDMTGNILYSWANTDQLIIARNIASIVTAAGAADGRPPVTIGTETSGKMRDLNISGLEFKRASEALDSMAQRAGGFEWTLEVRPDPSDGLPRLYFAPYFPQRGGLVGGLIFKKTPVGANNLLDYGPVEKTSADLRQRQWATGAGQPPDLLFAVDTAPDLAMNNKLMREDRTSYTSVTDRTTLSSHARAEREFYANSRSLLTVLHQIDRPSETTYEAGDRAALRIEDGWVNLDLPAARIVQKKVMPAKEQVEVVLDLDDYLLPEVDSGGTF